MTFDFDKQRMKTQHDFSNKDIFVEVAVFHADLSAEMYFLKLEELHNCRENKL